MWATGAHPSPASGLYYLPVVQWPLFRPHLWAKHLSISFTKTGPSLAEVRPGLAAFSPNDGGALLGPSLPLSPAAVLSPGTRRGRRLVVILVWIYSCCSIDRLTLKAVLSLNKKVDKQNSHSNVEQNHHDNQDRAVGLRGRKRERERERKGESVNMKHTHTHSQSSHMRLFSYLFTFLTKAQQLIHLLPQLVINMSNMIWKKKVK